MSLRVAVVTSGFLLIGLAACGPLFSGPGTPTQVVAMPESPTVTSSPSPTRTPTPAPPPTPDPESLPEAILILEPGPGSRVTSPVRIVGVADPAFEQRLAARIVLEDGTQLDRRLVRIQAGTGRRGTFDINIAFSVSGRRQAWIQVFSTGERDGGTTHLSSVGVTLAETGEAEIVRTEREAETIVIQQPALGARIRGGVARVEGVGLASFEGTLVIEIQNANGVVIGSRPVIVDAPDVGMPGAFSADVLYGVGGDEPGRIVVRDISPAFGGDVHLASVDVVLSP